MQMWQCLERPRWLTIVDGLHLSCWTRSSDTGPGMNPMLLLVVIAGRHAERLQLEQMNLCRFNWKLFFATTGTGLYWRHFQTGRGGQHVEDYVPQGGPGCWWWCWWWDTCYTAEQHRWEVKRANPFSLHAEPSRNGGGPEQLLLLH